MSEFVASFDSVKLWLDSLKLSSKMNQITFNLMRALEEATSFPDAFRRYLPGLKDVVLSGSGNADFADDENNEQLYNRLSLEGHVVSIAVGGGANGDRLLFYKASLENFTPLKGEIGKVSMYEFSMKKYASVPVIHGNLFENGDRIFSTPSAPTIALAGAGAGNSTNGTHSVKVTFVNALGESIPSAKSNVLNVTDNSTDGKINVTGITLGPAGTTSRKIYMSEAGDAGPWKLATTIANNTATTVQLNVADGSLGADAPSTGSYTGSEVINLGAVPAGKKFYGVLHVLAIGTGTLTVTFESDDNSGMTTPATVGSMTAATTLTQEIKSFTSNLDTYYRAKWTVSGGSGWVFVIGGGYAV